MIARIQWSEVKNTSTPYNEQFFVIFELTKTGMKFYERSSWDVTWRLAPATRKRIRSLGVALVKSMIRWLKGRLSNH